MMNIWVAPILSFTSEEVYGHIKGKKLDSVFLEEWPKQVINISEKEKDIGDILFSLKQLAAKKLDEARNKEVIGSSLDATIHLTVNTKIYRLLEEYKDELKFIFITSNCILQKTDSDGKTEIRIEKNEHSKCERCWHRNETVGSVKDHPGLCSRCHENVYLNGEKRKLG